MKSFLFINFFALALVNPFLKVNAAEPADELKVTSPNVYEYFNAPEGNVSLHIYPENGVWIVQKNIIASDGLPDPGEKHTFTNKKLAYEFATQKMGAKTENKNESALDEIKGQDDMFFELPKDIFTLAAKPKKDVLWEATNTWSWDWEIKFAKWMREVMHPNFFQEVKIQNDCQDAYVQSRMIFAYENKLPILFRLAGGGAVFTQNTMRDEWKSLSTDADWKKSKRFLKALDYLANVTYTHTLGRDSYPVEISKNGLIEGSAFLYLHEQSGHTLLVNEINLNNTSEEGKTRLPMYTLNSTVPKEVRPLYESFFFESTQPEKVKFGNTGFVRLRWPKPNSDTELVDAKDMPYYSEMQYDPEFMNLGGDKDDPLSKNFSIVVFKRLNPNYDPTIRLTEGLNEVKKMLEARKEVVIKGYEVCKKGCPEGSADYENWSTPSRDGRLSKLIDDLDDYQSNLGNQVPQVEKIWTEAFEGPIVNLEGYDYTLKHVKWAFNKKMISPDPNKTPDMRWSLSAKGFADSTYSEINALLTLRKNTIDKNSSCQNSSCDMFSESFNKGATFNIDYAIKSKVTTRTEYCENAGTSNCELFEKALSAFPGPSKWQSSFLSFWENVDLLNSDPRALESDRWGATSESNVMNLKGNWTYTGSLKNGLAVLEQSEYPARSISLLDIENRKIVFSTKTTGVVASVSENSDSLLWADIDQKQIYVYNPANNTTQNISFETAAKDNYLLKLSWHDENKFVFSDSQKIYIFENKGGHFSLSKVFPGGKIINGDYAYQTYNVQPDKSKPLRLAVKIIYLKDDSYPEWTSDWKSQINMDYVNGLSYEEHGQLLTLNWSVYENNSSKSGALVVNVLKQSSHTNNSELANSTNFKNGFYVYEAEKSAKIFFVDDELSIKKQITLEGSCKNCYSPSNYIQVGNKVYAFNREAQNVQVIATVPENVSLSYSFEQYAVFATSSKDEETYFSSLVDMSTGKVIKTANEISITREQNSITYPILDMTYSASKEVAGKKLLLSYTLTTPLDHLESGALKTSSYFGSDGEGGHHGEDGGDRSNTVEWNQMPNLTSKDFEFFKQNPLKIQLLVPQKSSANHYPLQIISGDHNTFIYFR